ncbi:hypothetical protein JW916_16845 [Candidatus Sumerlaeota bacterium]|nr:hypothetical protein [Candidatus Sumerlaeota bacterium]
MRRSRGSLPCAVAVAVLALVALLPLSVSFGQDASDSSSQKGVVSYEVARKFVVEKPYRPEENELQPDNVFLSTSDQVDDKIDVPTWKSPDKVGDLKQDLPQVSKTWHRALQDPAIEREKFFDLNRPPYFMGRNSIPLSDVEQIVRDRPGEIRSKENPKLKMVTRTLARGVMNTFCGFGEIPYRMKKHIMETDAPTGLAYGATEGFAFGVARTCTGAFEICRGSIDLVLFPFKTPEKLDHRVIVYPENIVSKIWGDPPAFLAEHYYKGDEPFVRDIVIE